METLIINAVIVNEGKTEKGHLIIRDEYIDVIFESDVLFMSN